MVMVHHLEEEVLEQVCTVIVMDLLQGILISVVHPQDISMDVVAVVEVEALRHFVVEALLLFHIMEVTTITEADHQEIAG